MIRAIISAWRRSVGRRFLRKIVTAELVGRLGNLYVRRERLGSRAINRLVEEIIDRAESISPDTTEQARQILKEAEKIAWDVTKYFGDRSACDPAVTRILDFHAGSSSKAEGNEPKSEKG